MQSPDPDAPHGPALTRYETDSTALVGRVLDGRYLIERVLGRGSMGLVLGARHVFLDRPVAVKILQPALLLVEATRQRFLREARAASQVEHEGVVSVSDFGVSEEGLHYLVMEYLEGTDLYAYAEAHGKATALAAAHIGVQVCEALIAIHAAGWIHRDLKPENLWVVAGSPPEAPKIKVIDLGIAAVIDQPHAGALEDRLTGTGYTLGTIHYMSPEQVMAEDLDGRSDIYSLGCILWELVTGECTFNGPSQMAVMMKHISEAPAAPSAHNPTVPKWFDATVLRCLEKRPEGRFATARDLRDALADGLAGGPVTRATTAPTGRPDDTPSFAETGTAGALTRLTRRRWPALAALAAVVVAVAVAVVIWRVTASDTGFHAALPVDVATIGGEGEAAGAVAADAPTVPAEIPAEVGALAWTALTDPNVTVPVTKTTAEATPTPVTLRFEVTPDGATVTVDGNSIGKTPLVLEVPKGSGEQVYTISLPGHETRTMTLTHARDQVIRRTLAPLRPPVTSPSVDDADGEKASNLKTRAPHAKPTGLMRPTMPGEGNE